MSLFLALFTKKFKSIIEASSSSYIFSFFRCSNINTAVASCKTIGGMAKVRQEIFKENICLPKFC